MSLFQFGDLRIPHWFFVIVLPTLLASVDESCHVLFSHPVWGDTGINCPTSILVVSFQTAIFKTTGLSFNAKHKTPYEFDFAKMTQFNTGMLLCHARRQHRQRT